MDTSLGVIVSCSDYRMEPIISMIEGFLGFQPGDHNHISLDGGAGRNDRIVKTEITRMVFPSALWANFPYVLVLTAHRDCLRYENPDEGLRQMVAWAEKPGTWKRQVHDILSLLVVSILIHRGIKEPWFFSLLPEPYSSNAIRAMVHVAEHYKVPLTVAEVVNRFLQTGQIYPTFEIEDMILRLQPQYLVEGADGKLTTPRFPPISLPEDNKEGTT